MWRSAQIKAFSCCIGECIPHCYTTCYTTTKITRIESPDSATKQPRQGQSGRQVGRSHSIILIGFLPLILPPSEASIYQVISVIRDTGMTAVVVRQVIYTLRLSSPKGRQCVHPRLTHGPFNEHPLQFLAGSKIKSSVILRRPRSLDMSSTPNMIPSSLSFPPYFPSIYCTSHANILSETLRKMMQY